MSTTNKQHYRAAFKTARTISVVSCLCFSIALAVMGYIIVHRYIPSPNQVSTSQQVRQKIDAYRQSTPVNQSPKLIATGLLLQSFEFVNAQTVRFSGYVWQNISNKLLKQGVTPGVVFPEANDDFTMTLIYDLKMGDHHVFGWHFYGLSLLQRFDYSTYPLDTQTVWIRMWPKDFDNNSVLTPALSSYISTKPGNIFGVEQGIVKNGFHLKEAYFDMPVIQYATNFGIPKDVGQMRSLELYYNLVVKRNFINPFFIHLLPIVVIWCILFSLVMMITSETKLAEKVKFSTMQLFIALGGIIFSVLVLNSNLRSMYVDQPILYIEYFYLFTYFIIMLIAFDAYFVTMQTDRNSIVRRNLLPKMLFWPLILCFITLLTALKFFIFYDPSYPVP